MKLSFKRLFLTAMTAISCIAFGQYSNSSCNNTDRRFLSDIIPAETRIYSCNQKYYLVIQQGDGNVVLYRSNSTPIWASHVYKQNVTSPSNLSLKVTGAGVEAQYNYVGNNGNYSQTYWSSAVNTMSYQPNVIVVQDDGNVVTYNTFDKQSKWATNTCCNK